MVAFSNILNSGFLLLSIGVGTEIINTSASIRSLASVVNKILSSALISISYSSFVLSIPLFNSDTLLWFLSNAITFLYKFSPVRKHFLVEANATANGNPTYPIPITDIVQFVREGKFNFEMFNKSRNLYTT